MAGAELQADLANAAQEELERAVTLSRKDMAECTPWGDTYEGYTPAGREVCFERNYLWAAEPGGDICVEVVVYLPEHYETGVRLTRTIPREDPE
jgi:hypothetical protein